MNSLSQLDDTLVNRAAPPGSMRYFSLLYTPPDRRDAIMALYVIDTEIREAARSSNHDVAHTRLQWWREEVDRLVNGAPQHPATRLLHDIGAVDRASYARLHEMLAAADMDLARITYSNRGELRAYCSRSAGATLELLAAHLVAPGPLDEAGRMLAHRMGVGLRQSEVLRDLRQDAYEGRVYLPLDELDQHGISTEVLSAREIDARLKEVLRSLREAARTELQPPARSAQTGRLRPLLVLAALHRRLLDRIATRHYDVASERIELGPVEKPWVAWRAARKSG